MSYLLYPTLFPGQRRPTLRFVSPYEVPPGLASGPVHYVPSAALAAAGVDFLIQKVLLLDLITY